MCLPIELAWGGASRKNAEVRPPGLRRDIRPLHDLREFGRYLAEMTAFRVGHVLMSLAFVIAGVRDVAAHSWWGLLLLVAGAVSLLAPAWFFYYRVPESTGPLRGKHSP